MPLQGPFFLGLLGEVEKNPQRISQNSSGVKEFYQAFFPCIDCQASKLIQQVFIEGLPCDRHCVGLLHFLSKKRVIPLLTLCGSDER